MTSHELAHVLLAGPDHPVFISVQAYDGLVSPALSPQVEVVAPWDEDDDFMKAIDLIDAVGMNVITISPRKFG